MNRIETLEYAKGRAEKLLEKGMWLGAWISFKADLMKDEDLRKSPFLSLGETLVKFLFESCQNIPVGSDEELAMKAYCIVHVRAMIEATS